MPQGKIETPDFIPVPHGSEQEAPDFIPAPQGTQANLPESTRLAPEERTFGNYLGEAAAGIGRGLKSDIVGAAQFIADPYGGLSQAAQQARQAATSAAKEFRETQAAPWYMRAAAAALTGAEEAPVIGEMVKKAEQGGTRLASPEALGATTEAITTFTAPEVAAKAVSGLAKGAARAIGGTHGAVGELADIVEERNKKAAEKAEKVNQERKERAEEKSKEDVEKHLLEAAEAAQETKGREITYESALTRKAKEIAEGDVAAEAVRRREHAAEAEKIREHNKRVLDKHNADAKRIREENAAQEHVLENRKQQEASLKTDTDKYYQQEDAAKAKAKGEENSAWERWRDKIRGKTIDGGEIAKNLESLKEGSPEVARVLKRLQSPPEEAAPESLYAQDRAAIMKSQGMTGNYFDYPPETRKLIDSIAESSGFSPEPIDFDPTQGTAIPIEQVHRAQSIIDQSIRSGKFEGPLLGEMKQVSKTLRAAITRASMGADALKDLESARGATKTYQEAFGRERHLPQTQDEIREKQANPEAYKEREDEERLSNASAYDPSLVESYRKVKKGREALKSLPTEEQLRKSQKQVPPPPTVNDLREGYRLKPEPKPLQPQLTSGSAKERAFEQVEQPHRVLPSDRPTPRVPKVEVPKFEKIGAAEAKAAKEAALAKRIKLVKHRGDWIVSGIAGYDLLRDVMGGKVNRIPSVASEAALALASVAGVTKLLEYPPFQKMLTRMTEEDVRRIPPSIRGDFTDVVKKAKQSKLPLSPALANLTSVGTIRKHPILSAQSPVQDDNNQ